MKQVKTRKFGGSAIALLLSVLLVLAPISVLAAGYGSQGTDAQLCMTDPAASNISTEKLANGDILNTISTPLDAGSISFSVDIGGAQGNSVSSSVFNNYMGIYESTDIATATPVYMYPKDSQLKITKTSTTTTANISNGKKFTISVSGLGAEKTYYLVFKAGMGYQGRQFHSIGNNNIIFKFTTMDPNKVNSVSLNQSQLLFDGLAQTYQLTADVNPGSALNKNVSWFSSDPSVASVDETGLVTGKTAGTADITVKTEDGDKEASCKVTVRNTSGKRILYRSSGQQGLGNSIGYEITNPVVYCNCDTAYSTWNLIPEKVAVDAPPAISFKTYYNGGNKATHIKIKVYDDKDFTNEIASDEFQNYTEIAHNNMTFTAKDPHNNLATRFTNTAIFQPNHTYYYVIEKTSTFGSTAVGKDIVIEFTTKGAEAEEDLSAQLTAAPETEAEIESQVTLNAAAKGGTGEGYMYRFSVKDNATDTTTVLQDYDSADSFVWDTDTVGEKTFYVSVKDSYGNTAQAELPYSVIKKKIPLAATLTATPENTAENGSQVKLEAGCTGGSGEGYMYRFSVIDNTTGTTTVVQEFSEQNTAVWTTDSTGEKTLLVTVMDSLEEETRAEILYMVTEPVVTPTEPTKPAEPTTKPAAKPAADGKTESPDTEDRNNVSLWAVVLVLSGAVLVMVVNGSREKEYA